MRNGSARLCSLWSWAVSFPHYALGPWHRAWDIEHAQWILVNYVSEWGQVAILVLAHIHTSRYIKPK